LLQQAAMQPKGPLVLGLESEAAQLVHPYNDRYVNTDFATEQSPGQALTKTIALQPNTWYFFRLNVGELEPSSIEATPEQLPEFLADQEIDVTVVLFSESFEIEQNTGVLHVPATGAASVQARAAAPANAGEDLLNTRLLFRVRTPLRIGRADLRVNLYCRG